MPPHKCSYFRCQNISGTKSMFRFPSNDAKRLEVWLNNCGNMTIARLPPESLRSRYLCIDHFNEKYVRPVHETSHRKRLLRTAIPDPYQTFETEDSSSTSSSVLGSPHLEVQRPQKVYRNRGPFCEVEEIQDALVEENRTWHWSTPKRRRKKHNKEDINTTKYGTRDSITLPGVSQLEEDNVAEIPPQTSKDAPMETIKVYTIIANVYNYLSREYELLKSQLGKRCDLSSLANILERTAAATGVSQRVVNAALDTLSVRSDHTYSRGNTRQDDESDGEGLRPPKRTARNSVKSKPTDEEQLPSNTHTVSGSKTKREDRIPNYKCRTDSEEDNDSEGEGVRPPKRRSARNSVTNVPSDEEQLPFPSPIQFGLSEITSDSEATEFKAEPAHDECQQMLENDPLGLVSRSPIHCRTPEATETVFKAEPPDDECLQKPEVDPLETESSPATLEESSDASEVEMKLERVDEYADVCTDYSICDSALLDIKPEPPAE